MMLDSDLTSLYQFYHNMHYFGKYSIYDIDNMLPFERDIYFGMLNKTIDEENKINKGQR